MEHNDRLDDWLTAARSDLAQRQPDLLAEQQLLARVREMRALQSVTATRLSTTPPPRDRDSGIWRRSFNWRAAALAGAAMPAIAMSVVILTPNAPRRDAIVRTPFLALVAIGSDCGGAFCIDHSFASGRLHAV